MRYNWIQKAVIAAGVVLVIGTVLYLQGVL